MIVDEIVRNGGDIYTGYFPGKFSDVANVYSRSVYIQNIPLNHGEMEEETTLI